MPVNLKTLIKQYIDNHLTKYTNDINKLQSIDNKNRHEFWKFASLSLTGFGTTLGFIYMIKNDLNEFKFETYKQFNSIEQKIQHMDKKITTLDNKINKLENRIDIIENKLNTIEKIINITDTKIDKVDIKLDTILQTITANQKKWL